MRYAQHHDAKHRTIWPAYVRPYGVEHCVPRRHYEKKKYFLEHVKYIKCTPSSKKEMHRRLGILCLLSAPPQLCLASVSFGPWKRGGSRPPSAGGLRSPGFRVKFWWGGAQVVVAAPFPIKSPRLQPHLDGDVEKFMGVVWFSRTSGGGVLRIVMELHRRFILLLRLRDGCGLLDPFGDFPSETNNVKLALGEAAAAVRRRHGLEVEDEGHLKDLVVIFVFFRCFIVRCSFRKKK